MNPPTYGGRQHYGTLAALTTGAMAFSISQTMIVPALSVIQQALGVSQSSVAWVFTVYLLAASIATPVLGRLGDIFGKGRVFFWVLVAFGLGSMVAALSDTLPVLIAGRTIQGAGGAVFPLAYGIIRDEFPRKKAAQAIGLLSATIGVGGGAGLLLAGVIIDALSYEWIFWLAVIVVSFAVVMTRFFVPQSPGRRERTKLDWSGAGQLAAGLATLLFAISEGNSWGWGSARVLGLLAMAVAVLVMWTRFEARQPEPLVDMRMMRLRGVWTTNVVALLTGCGMLSSLIIVPQFVQTSTSAGYGFGASVVEAGLFQLPTTIVVLLAGPLSGWMSARYGPRVPLLCGLPISAAGLSWLALECDQQWQVVVGTTLIGLGIGFAMSAIANAVLDAVAPTQTGVAMGMNAIMRTIGGSIGAQVATAIVTGSVIVGTPFPTKAGYTGAFAFSATALVVGAIVALFVPRPCRGAGNAEQVRGTVLAPDSSAATGAAG